MHERMQVHSTQRSSLVQELNDPNGDLMTKVIVPATQPHQHRGIPALERHSILAP